MAVDRRALNVLLAVLEIEQHELAKLMGYREGYVANVLSGCTKMSASFREAFGATLAELVLGPTEHAMVTLPAAPLAELIHRRAAQAPCKAHFYEDLDITPHGWNKRKTVNEALVDRICCALGVHPSALYANSYEEGTP